MADKARECALGVLRRVWGKGAYSNLEIGTALGRYGLEGKDRAFCVALVNGAIERAYCLDFLIERASGRRVAEVDGELLYVLRLGFLQLFYMNVPDMAACSESVALVKGRGGKGFVNAVMRSACRGRKGLVSALDGAEGYIRASLSKDVYSLLKNQYPDDMDRITAAFYGKNALCLRTNTLRTTSRLLSDALNAEGAEAVPYGKAVLVRRGAPAALEAVKGGFAFVQGLSSQEAVEALAASEGDTVVDVCACPGGKSFGAALDMGGKGRVISLDLHGGKLDLIKKGAAALGIDIIETRKHDGRRPAEELAGAADRVICDVPCSGLGAIKGRPEIRYKSLDTLESLISTQKEILKNAWGYLKSGGRLVYSTCTINKDENEGVLLPFAESAGARLIRARTVMPYEEDRDGFFFAVLEKA